MKYAAVVLYNNHNSHLSVEFAPVTDALLAGGVFLGETVILPYDAPSEVTAALLRLSTECDGVFVVCDTPLLPSAREAVSVSSGEKFSEEYLLETNNCLYAVLPAGEKGAEIVRSETVPRVDRRRGNSYLREIVCTVGAPAELVASALSRAREVAAGKLSLHASEKNGCGRIEMIYDRNTPKMTADEVVRILASDLSEYVYSMNDESIAERLVSALQLHRLHISTAESFTGGGVGRAIVRVPGASSVYFEGLNTYDELSKQERLGVREFTLNSKGAVSDETAYEMAAGLLAAGHCDIAVSTTGVAGPESDRAGTPVGLCYIAVGTKSRVRVFRYRFTGDRESITETAINYALFLAYKEIR